MQHEELRHVVPSSSFVCQVLALSYAERQCAWRCCIAKAEPRSQQSSTKIAAKFPDDILILALRRSSDVVPPSTKFLSDSVLEVLLGLSPPLSGFVLESM
jgi:hypothetical protein